MSMFDLKMPTIESEDLMYRNEKARILSAQASMYEAQANVFTSQIQSAEDRAFERNMRLVKELPEADPIAIKARAQLNKILFGEE